ncbi:MAG: pyrroline-5-carboxylate reductase [Candidatus Omnitrophica bacterium]|nr:pyrroline-5-carboxylate reductase [Candidatus Omnitrophota bacterium]
MKKINKRIGFIGCGNMGCAILEGIILKKVISARNIIVYDIAPGKRQMLKQVYGVRIARTENELVKHSDIVIIAVKPQALASVDCTLSKNELAKKIFVSILAGIPIRKIKNALFAKKIIRVMPNLGAMFSVGVTAIAYSRSVKKRDFNTIVTLFKTCGEVVFLPEHKMNEVTAISGSGPAYYFYLSELLINAAVKSGLPLNDAYILVTKTAHAATLMMDKSDATPARLRAMVTSKGGTTEAALKAFKTMKLDKAVAAGVKAAINRGVQLSK